MRKQICSYFYEAKSAMPFLAKWTAKWTTKWSLYPQGLIQT